MAAPAPSPRPSPPLGARDGDPTPQPPVDDIPKDTLVALVKRKDKEARSLSAKLEKLEERYVKAVRGNKVLTDDRTSFQQLCNELLPTGCCGLFEAAAAQDVPVSLDGLLQHVRGRRAQDEVLADERKVFQQFTEAVFPRDEEVSEIFQDGKPLGNASLDMLLGRWNALEDLHNQSIASVNSMAREQMMSRSGDLESAQNRAVAGERKVEELTQQLAQLHKERAQRLTQKLGGGGREPSPPGGEGGADAPAGAAREGDEARLRELREALDAGRRREREAQEAASKREEDLRRSVEAHQDEAQRARRDLRRAEEQLESQRGEAEQAAEESDLAAERMRSKLLEAQQEADSNAFIVQLAEHQAGRDAEVRSAQHEVDDLKQTIGDLQKSITMSFTQEKALKARIRELENSHGRGHVAGDYLKHVVLKYMEYTRTGDLKASGLVPVLCTLLSLTPDERRSVEQQSLPQSLLLINQAVGNTASWLKGPLQPLPDGGGDASWPPPLEPPASPSSGAGGGAGTARPS